MRELNRFEKEFERRGYKIDDNLPECELHCSQMMWNPSGHPECVVCTGNEIGLILYD